MILMLALASCHDGERFMSQLRLFIAAITSYDVTFAAIVVAARFDFRCRASHACHYAAFATPLRYARLSPLIALSPFFFRG